MQLQIKRHDQLNGWFEFTLPVVGDRFRGKGILIPTHEVWTVQEVTPYSRADGGFIVTMVDKYGKSMRPDVAAVARGFSRVEA